ncbi:hypothetical protein G6F62_015269 [Rhizopus arrhizus]|nr:hypothetical protein G6F68_020645 [Rhizopus microsporus]KAG1307197.1 hypothetical protein G6F62_015269 [Rhizopus arrhizus]
MGMTRWPARRHWWRNYRPNWLGCAASPDRILRARAGRLPTRLPLSSLATWPRDLHALAACAATCRAKALRSTLPTAFSGSRSIHTISRGT